MLYWFPRRNLLSLYNIRMFTEMGGEGCVKQATDTKNLTLLE